METEAAAARVPTIGGLPRPLARALEGYAERLDVEAVRAAWELAEEAHAGQFRASGEPFITHAAEVATILAELQLDTDTVVAALVHDVVEDTVVSLQGIRELCGEHVAAIVDGVTKIGKVRFRSNPERQVENYRKLLLSMVKDVRVILVKLADRLHNMRTLEYLRPAKQRPIARETREIYAPLAHRLGMAAIKWELEDLAFKFLDREAYDNLRKLVRQRRRAREQHVLAMRRPLEDALKAAGIVAEVTGRPKHLWSIHRKMVTQNRDYDDIYDLMALRVITDSERNCYAALGIIHGRWTPIQARFHDYIAMPKTNEYRSLHTTVYGTGGHRYEIQIRTREMHQTAEFGIAAHWVYKEGGKAGAGIDEKESNAIESFRKGILEWQQDAREPEDFMESLSLDLFQSEIFVFTPQGDVKQLPVGSSPIDFAFSVHTEVGMHCAGAKVNGRIAPLSRRLRSGDSVEIITKPSQKPNRDWLGFVKTARARQRIRQSVRREEHAQALRLGREYFRRELRKSGRPKPNDAQMARSARKLGVNAFDDVLAALARGDIDPSAVIAALYPGEDPAEVVKRTPSALERIKDRIRKSNSLTIQGMDNMMTHYSQCCQPVPGDRVMGYITRGRGVTIHRTDCPNVLNLVDDPGRRIEIAWKAEKEERFFVHLRMEGTNRQGLLSDVARAISETATDIRNADMRKTDWGGMTGSFVVEVKDLPHLNRVLRAARRVKGVTKVIRRESIAENELSVERERPAGTGRGRA